MKRILLASAVLILAACEPMDLQFQRDSAASSSSASAEPEVIDAAMDDAAITIEPFAEPTETQTTSGTTVQIAESTAAGTLILGNGNATPLAIAIYLHPLSHYAREFQRLRMPTLLEKFVEPGRLTIQLVMLPIEKYPGTADAVRTVTCASAQGKGYAAHVRLFEAEATLLSTEDVASLELDALAFSACMSDTSDPLASLRTMATQNGVTLVPTYVIRDEVFVGLPTEADLLGAINAAL